ncbi:MAG TPA: tripartite tricarboxylate transporter substrate binding protein [Reyranella sp.]|nr:tripartite tricarboxylate transporter substrate binding protein [Reyranella sp.]
MTQRFLVSLLAALLAVASPAFAGWPDHPVRVVVPYAPGGPVDLVARVVSERLAEKYGQSFVVENKPGANGAIGVQAVMSSPPDGYTLLAHGSAGYTIYQAVMAQPAFDTLRDLAPVSTIAYFDLILCANPELPFTDVKGFVAYAKAHPGKLSYGTAGIGAMNHVGTEWFKTMAGIDIIHVPYRGDAPVAADLISGTIGVSFLSSNVAIPFIKSGKLRALAVPRKNRMEALPEVPTMAEQGYSGFDLRPWTGFFGPAKLDPAILGSLNGSLKEILGMPDVVHRLAGLGMQATWTTPQDMARTIEASTALWKKVAAQAHIVVE